MTKHEEFLVPVEIAKKLKEIGFDKPCLFDYRNDNIYLEGSASVGFVPDPNNAGFVAAIEQLCEFSNRDISDWVTIPTYEMAFAWFRKKEMIGIVSTRRITNRGGFEYCGFIDDLRIGGKIHYTDDSPSYESSRLKVLNKLIELYKKDDKTFEFTGETMLHGKVVLNRIRAIVDIPERRVKKGDVGGWIEKETNLFGEAWVYGESKVYGDAKVYGNAEVTGGSEVRDNAKVYGEARIRNKSTVKDYASVYDNTVVNKSEVKSSGRLYGNAVITDESMIGDYAFVYEDAFIEKSSVYGNASVSGKVIVKGKSIVYDRAIVSGNVEIYDRSSVHGDVILNGEIKITNEASIH
nr:MAG TPA: hypothetical protein [Caudoviricetes sp.]